MKTSILTQKSTKNTITIPTSIIPEKMNLRIRVLHAVDYPEIAQKFYEGQQEVLEEFNVDKSAISSIKESWWENSGSYIFVVEDVVTGEIGAGMRLDVVDPTHPIPLEQALADVEPELVTRIHKHNYILAETCGWWVRKSFSERNLPHLLMRAAISVAEKLRIKIILGFFNQYTRKTIEVMGFRPVNNLGENATFNYPNEKYQSTVMEFYLEELNNLPQEEVEMINWLKHHPVQKFHDEFKGRVTNFQYDLRIM
ncbi:hypothetical protein V9L05_09445 [Bernardetia sp. Wsw4-3y2]|uniref:hypothetical protein n=1 Tax=Bernardetia sp. Wsw4-3y2 TaxID=3127471 RepID=UPI0030D1ADD0